MNDLICYQKVDYILNLFYGYYPYGTNYFKLTCKLNIEAEEWEAIYEFMIKEYLIMAWGEDDNQIITEKGILLIKEHCGVQKYIARLIKKDKLTSVENCKDFNRDKKHVKDLPSKIINQPSKITEQVAYRQWVDQILNDKPET